MSRNTFELYENDEVLPAVNIFASMNASGALVFNDSRELVGMITERELIKGISENSHDLRDIMLNIGQIVYEDDDIKSMIVHDQDIFPVMNKNQEYTGVITRRQLLETFSREVSLELSHLDAIFNSAHNGILSIDDKGYITSLNPAAERMAGTTKENAIGRFVTDVVTPKGLLDVLRTGESTTEKYSVGNRKYITNRTPLFKNNKIVGVVGVFQDISEIDFVYDELNTVKKLLFELDIVIESTNEGILILDRYGKVIKVNQAFFRILGLKKPPNYYQELLGDYLSQCMVSLVVDKEEKVTIMDLNKMKRNQLMITGTPIQNEKQVNEFRIVVTIRDISEQDSLRKELEKTKQHLHSLMNHKQADREFIAHSPAMRGVMDNLDQIAHVDSTVLILGESGVGKEEISNMIHTKSHRKTQPFVKVNCGAIPESLVDSELFGYENGAFTGAKKGGNLGYFERAHGGTILLDEVGELPFSIQVKLLRVLQEKEIMRVGGSKPIKIDVRVITATNKDLMQLVMEKKFRKDLYYRLNVIPIKVPPLRERVEDIPLLIRLFQERVCFKYGLEKTISDAAVQMLSEYQWPGNVRELVNTVERLVVTLNKPVIEKEDVINVMNQQQPINSESCLVYVNGIMPLREAVDEVEKQLIEKAMKLYKNTRSTAHVLKINQSTVVRKLQKFGGQANENLAGVKT